MNAVMPIPIGTKAVLVAKGKRWQGVKGDGYWIAARLSANREMIALDIIESEVFDDAEVDSFFIEPDNVH